MEPLERLKQNLDEEIRLHPRYPDLVNLLGLLLALEGRHTEALKEYDRALEINPRYTECKTNRAFSLAALGRTDEALKAAEALSCEAPDSCDVLVSCAKLLAWQGRTAPARAILEKAAELRPNYPAVYHYLGLTYLTGDREKACANFEKAASLGSAYIALYDSLHIYRNGGVKLAGGKDPAVKALLNQLADNPNSVKVYLAQAKMFAAGGQFDEASSHFDKARAIEADSPVIENGLGLVAIAREYGEEAKLHFRRALHFDPANITAHVNLAFQLGADGDLNGAEEQMRKAVELAPRYPDIRVQLATILTEREQLDEAITHLREALSINPKYVFAAIMLGSILFAKKRYQEVIDTYAGMDADAIGLPEVYSHLATSHLETGKTDSALEIAGKAVSMENPLPSTYVCLVIGHHRLGKVKEARSWALKYVKQFPEGPEIEEIRTLVDLLKDTPDA